MTALIQEAQAMGARRSAACQVVGICERTLQRWQEGGGIKEDGRIAAGAKRVPKSKFSEAERQKILETVNHPEFAGKSPKEIVPTLLDRGEYIGSESTIYRVLREKEQLAHRSRAKPKTSSEPKRHVADGPNQLWSWDITYLPRDVKGLFFYLYLIVDIYSRKIVGWEVYDVQSEEYAAQVASKATLREGQRPRILHSDNGAPMKGQVMLAMLEKLGVAPSFSRPRVSNDNAFSEALFKTLKYVPFYPEKPFTSLLEAREWVEQFVGWYNEEHHHSAIQFVTPSQRHQGADKEILAKRDALQRQQKIRRPDRWSGDTRNWTPVGEVYLNPCKETEKVKNL